jgi:hypothetical protein
MGQGFGKKSDEQLGYLLLLMPEVTAYAAKFSIAHDGEDDFIGITTRLEYAQIWKNINQAKQALEMYIDFLIEEAESTAKSKINIEIKRLKRSADGKLITESVESMFLARKND